MQKFLHSCYFFFERHVSGGATTSCITSPNKEGFSKNTTALELRHTQINRIRRATHAEPKFANGESLAFSLKTSVLNFMFFKVCFGLNQSTNP
ncbi:hypothetical protein WAI453_003793 [Rhynchosporium graminicola]